MIEQTRKSLEAAALTPQEQVFLESMMDRVRIVIKSTSSSGRNSSSNTSSSMSIVTVTAPPVVDLTRILLDSWVVGLMGLIRNEAMSHYQSGVLLNQIPAQILTSDFDLQEAGLLARIAKAPAVTAVSSSEIIPAPAGAVISDLVLQNRMSNFNVNRAQTLDEADMLFREPSYTNLVGTSTVSNMPIMETDFNLVPSFDGAPATVTSNASGVLDSDPGPSDPALDTNSPDPSKTSMFKSFRSVTGAATTTTQLPIKHHSSLPGHCHPIKSIFDASHLVGAGDEEHPANKSSSKESPGPDSPRRHSHPGHTVHNLRPHTGMDTKQFPKLVTDNIVMQIPSERPVNSSNSGLAAAGERLSEPSLSKSAGDIGAAPVNEDSEQENVGPTVSFHFDKRRRASELQEIDKFFDGADSDESGDREPDHQQRHSSKHHHDHNARGSSSSRKDGSSLTSGKDIRHSHHHHHHHGHHKS